MAFRIRDLEAEKGRFVHGRLDVDGVPIPLIAGAGKNEGPMLLIVSAQHRTEFSGPGMVHRLLTSLDLARVRGTVVILPLTSILQIAWQRDELDLYRDRFDEEARRTIGRVNMNRVWPGQAEGNFIERAAHAIYQDLCRGADAVLDFHCCRFADGRFAAAAEAHRPSIELAKAFGFPVIDLVTPESYSPGLLHIEGALDLGVPMILVETYPGHSTVMEETVAACEQGVMNTLVHLGMTEGDLALPVTQTIFRRADPVEVFKAEAPGFLGTCVAPGAVVGEGDLLCVVRGLETFEAVQEVRAPRDGGVPSVGPGSKARNNLVVPGEEVCTFKRVHEVVRNRQ